MGGFLSFTDQQRQQYLDLKLPARRADRLGSAAQLAAPPGALVNISSNGARMPHAGLVTYTTAKAALTAFGKTLAEEFGPQGMRINTISPGPVRAAM